MKRAMCVWFPGWPLQRLWRTRSELSECALILHTPGPRSKLVVSRCSPHAVRLGVRPGMPLAEARALTASSPAITKASPGEKLRKGETARTVHYEQQDFQADRAALHRLAVWCQRFSPLVAVEQAEHPECLAIDITGCGPLFGGEEALAINAHECLRRLGLRARVAISDTFGSAWAAAHFIARRDTPCCILPVGEHRALLGPLPIEALRIPAEALSVLRTFDIRRVDQLLALPRAELPSRFGLELARRLDQAIGEVAEVFTPEREAEPAEASWTFEPPISDMRVIERFVAQLLADIVNKLRPHDFGVQQMLCEFQTGNQTQQVHIGLLQPTLSERHLQELLGLHIERVRLPAEVAHIRLHVVHALPMEYRQNEMFAETAALSNPALFATLIERLSHRLGSQAVLRPRLCPDAQPEFACTYDPWITFHANSKANSKTGTKFGGGTSKQRRSKSPALAKGQTRSQAKRSSKKDALKEGSKDVAKDEVKAALFEEESGGRRRRFCRPLRLKAHPAAITVTSTVPGGSPHRFLWQNQSYAVARSWGPERIETGWWRGQDIRRDYYLVEASTGERFWLFRTLAPPRWFLHGTYQ